ncbi:MAG: hypothetical protein JNJ73_05505 [Hyphomonadaceae bacterium]|nr:hypothetical protein [Hyphomonadaceae bacterium]
MGGLEFFESGAPASSGSLFSNVTALCGPPVLTPEQLIGLAAIGAAISVAALPTTLEIRMKQATLAATAPGFERSAPISRASDLTGFLMFGGLCNIFGLFVGLNKCPPGARILDPMIVAMYLVWVGFGVFLIGFVLYYYRSHIVDRLNNLKAKIALTSIRPKSKPRTPRPSAPRTPPPG